MKVFELISEARDPNRKYEEKHVKGQLAKVTLVLDGIDSASASRLATRYKRLEQTLAKAKEKRDELNAKIKGEFIDDKFDAEDILATRIVETIKYTISVSKTSMGDPKTTIDYESAFSHLARLVPELTDKVDEIIALYTKTEPGKPSTPKLSVTNKLEESLVSDWIKKAKAFLKDLVGWGRSYDAKLDEFRRKFNLKAV